MNIYVGNLPFRTNSEDLAAMFRHHGEVTSAQVVTDRDTGRSRGFGFVEMADEEAAKAAIEALNGSDVAGREIVVNEARPRTERGPRPGGDRRGGGGYGRDRGGYGGGGGGGGGGRDRGYGGGRDRRGGSYGDR